MPDVCAPTVNNISMPVVAAAGTEICAEYCDSVELTVQVPVAICVLVGLAILPNVSAVLA